MADRGEPHPLDPRRHRVRRTLSRDDVGNQARFLMSHFIHDRISTEGVDETPEADALVEPGTPSGSPPVEHLREVATCLRKIGDELDNDRGLQRMLQQITPDSPQQTFMAVAKEIFADGVFNWGRVVALFYFGYKMVAKALRDHIGGLPLIRSIVEWVVHFITDYVAPWIIERGGWEAVREHFGATINQTLAVLLSGVVVSALFVLWRNRANITNGFGG